MYRIIQEEGFGSIGFWYAEELAKGEWRHVYGTTSATAQEANEKLEMQQGFREARCG
jgi:prephenate dehydrogenase